MCKSHPVIYDLLSKVYRDVTKKNMVWKEVTEIVDAPGERMELVQLACFAKCNLRTKYVMEIKQNTF